MSSLPALLCLLMKRMLLAKAAVLVHFHAIRVELLLLREEVIPLLTLCAC